MALRVSQLALKGWILTKSITGIHDSDNGQKSPNAEYRGHQIIGFFCQFIQAKIGTIPFKHGKFNVVTATISLSRNTGQIWYIGTAKLPIDACPSVAESVKCVDLPLLVVTHGG